MLHAAVRDFPLQVGIAVQSGDKLSDAAVPLVLRAVFTLIFDQKIFHVSLFSVTSTMPPPQTFGGACSPRKIAAFRAANSAKLVGRRPRILGVIAETLSSLPLRRSANSSTRASARYGGTPLASAAFLASSGAMLTYRIVLPT